MSVSIQGFVSLMFIFLQLVIQGAVILLLFNKSVEWGRLSLFAFINVMVNYLPTYVIPQDLTLFYTVIFFVSLFFSLKLVLKFKYLHSFLATSFIYLFSAIGHYTSMAILKVCLQGFELFSWINESFANQVIARNLGTLIYILLLVFVYYFKLKINIPEDISRKRTSAILINVIAVVSLIVPNIVYLETMTQKFPINLLLFNAVVVLIMLVLSINNVIRYGEIELSKREIHYQNMYINALSELTDRLNVFKHDFNNILQSIGGFIALKDYNGLGNYYRQMCTEAHKISNIDLSSFVKDHPPIYGLLYSKLSYCEANGIEVDIKILSRIDISDLTIFDFCKILGILLDNAVEAAEKCERKFVRLHMNESDDCVLKVEISNTFSGSVNTEKIYEKGVSSKENPSGYGLWEAKRILSRYKNYKLSTFVIGDYFTQSFTISQ